MAAPAAATTQQPATNVSQTSLSATPLPQSPPPPPQQQQQQPHQYQQHQSLTAFSSLSPPSSNAPSLQSPSPSKTSLTTWWKGFKSKPLFRKPEEQEIANKGIFGVSLNTSIQYAYVNISITNPHSGNSEVYGKIPIIVAKCGVFLKEKATDVEGIFRVSGSAKRIKELQTIFDSPPTYGKTLDWDGYNVHDAANVFRRYINHLPESIIPHEYYFAFRKPLQKDPRDVEETIKMYQQLIGELPKLNGQLLLYILDLLAVFAENSAANLMPAANLAAIFQPGLISHPDHGMNPQEYRVSQEVLIFLIEHQDRFLPTSATVQRAPSPMRKPVSPRTQHQQSSAPPAKYPGTHSARDNAPNIPRRRTIPKKSETSPGFSGVGHVLRRHRSTRTPQSPKLAVEEEEPRRVSESSAPSTSRAEDDAAAAYLTQRSASDRDRNYESRRDDVLSSPVAQSSEPHENGQAVEESTAMVVSPLEENAVSEPTIERDVNSNIGEAPKQSDGESKGQFLSVTSTPMGRSSSYREELDEVIDYGEQTTSADNTEAEASDGACKPEKPKKKRMSKLPWSKDPDANLSESKLNLSAHSLPSESPKPAKKLQKKNRAKESDSQSATGLVATPASEMSQSERGLGRLSPPPWTQHNNVSQSSLNASIPSRRSHVSSARSSAEVPRAATPLERRPISGAATTFDEIRRLTEVHDDDDDLPTAVVMPAAREDKPRAGSQSSNHSAGSSAKGGKIGAWLRKKRGFSVSSANSGGGGGSVVSD